ncbi:phosphopantetheine-binding protein [Micromonospora sp. RP3T]|uniref:phosphopantetheine-binding protein n=1 Tax=Micromonospora sp. RP3T TaxID=2135446 RepID=UPI000D1552E5|nr:phosphopantetheine-binding protein [Micromonospora sp. RP3T]PTA46445.1 hypothetical protein C8054_10320 [Micromonospora sp. RP3T]
MPDSWPSAFEKIMRAHLPRLDPAAPLTATLRPADQGVDSLALVSLLLELEEEFDVPVPDDALLDLHSVDVGQLAALMGCAGNALGEAEVGR